MKEGVTLKVYTAIIKGGRILMTQDVDGDNGWKFPGGHVEEKELVKDAAKREIKEEIGLDVDLLGIFLIEDYFKSTRPDEHHQKIFLVAEPVTENIIIKTDEVKEAKWFSKNEFLELPVASIYPAHLKAFKKFTETNWAYNSIDMIV